MGVAGTVRRTAAESVQNPEGDMPHKIVVSAYPSKCNCKLCNMDYCDCSEPESGTVWHSDEYWEKGD